MPLPRHFLIEIARKYDLSSEQEDAFVIWFSSNKTVLEIATELHITDKAVRTRMGHVYRKFGINGKGPGKYGRLLNFLTAESQKSKASVSPTANLSEEELNALAQEVREKCCEMIQDLCGTMRSLTMSQPIDVSELYTNVNILEKIPSRQWREVDQMVQNCNPENFDRFGCGKITDRGIPGLEAVEKYSKLMVLGKPGSGKTTFLKHLAIQCNTGKFQAHRVPIFITLKQFAEAEEKPSLLEYITQMFSDCDVSADQMAVLLKHGKILVLLDGLDEVKIEDNSRVIKQVRDLSDKIRTNQFVMTCRIAASNYNFEKFKDVEVADFDEEQIEIFAQNWFKNKEPNKSKEFIEQIQENDPIRELATNPLLLTLLCLVFEESGKFPDNSSELYEEGVDILLKQWDETRNVERDQIYKNISLQRKKDLLSQIALTTFERGDYLFKQKELEQYISDYIHNLPDAQNDPQAVLKSIEAQHGLLVERAQKIYSFSHLTFQEYFTAKYYSDISESKVLGKLVTHIAEPRWQEVFLLAVLMLNNPNCLLILMKKSIDRIVDDDDKIQQFLKWLIYKSNSVNVPCQPIGIRAFYFLLELFDYEYAFDQVCYFDSTFELALHNIDEIESPLLLADDNDLNLSLFSACNFDIAIDHELSRIFHRAFILALQDEDYSLLMFRFRVLTVALNRAIALNIKPKFKQSLEELREQIPKKKKNDFNKEQKLEYVEEYSSQITVFTSSVKNQSMQVYKYEPLDDKDIELIEWWKDNGLAWVENLTSVMIEHRNIGHNWQFNGAQIALLQQYYDANKLLVECLNSGCVVSDGVRQEIEETLLLPTVDI